MNINANKSPRAVRAISFGEMLTSRNLYVVLVVFAVAALGAFLTTAQVTNSTASLQGTLSQAEATKIKIKGAQVSALANLPNTAKAADFVGTGTDLSGTLDGKLTGWDTSTDKIIVGVVGTKKTDASLTVNNFYKNDSSVYETIDRGATTRFIFSQKDLGQDLPGFEYSGTGALGTGPLNRTTVYIYKSVIPE